MEKPMILSTIRMVIPSPKRSEALKILGTMTAQTRDDIGCLECSIYEDLQEKNTLLFKEIWETEEDLAFHIRTDKYRDLLLVMEMADKRPEIRFHTISESTGIETIEKFRDPN